MRETKFIDNHYRQMSTLNKFGLPTPPDLQYVLCEWADQLLEASAE